MKKKPQRIRKSTTTKKTGKEQISKVEHGKLEQQPVRSDISFKDTPNPFMRTSGDPDWLRKEVSKITGISLEEYKSRFDAMMDKQAKKPLPHWIGKTVKDLISTDPLTEPSGWTEFNPAIVKVSSRKKSNRKKSK